MHAGGSRKVLISMYSGESPRPHEPDVHLRISTPEAVFDFRGCAESVENLIRKWPAGYGFTPIVLDPGNNPLPERRMPCEELWLPPD